MVMATGRLAEALNSVVDSLYPFLIKYGAQQLSELDRQPISRLRRIADGIGRIHAAESGKDS